MSVSFTESLTPSIGAPELLFDFVELPIAVWANTVARLLHQMNYSLRVNRKQLATASSPDREQQFGLHLLAAPALPTPRPPQHQRRHQEAGTAGQLQQPRSQVGPLAAAGERPRFPL